MANAEEKPNQKANLGVAEELENSFALNDLAYPNMADDGVKEENIGIQLPEISRVAEKELVRKLDLHLVPVVMLLYLLSYLDRINVGNARLYSLEADLGLHGSQYQIAVSLFFCTYVAFEIPSNLVLKKFTPSRFLSGLTVGWGLIATLTGLCQNFAGLVACRLLLGVVEAGLFPGLVIYLTTFYTRNEIALRIGYLACCAALAGGCGGLLALGIGKLDGAHGLHGWRWIFIIEGIPTFFLGIATFFLLPNNHETAYFLTKEDKALMDLRWAHQIGHTTSAHELHKVDVEKAFADWKIWLFSTGQFACDLALYSFSTFLPTIIKGLDPSYSNAEVQGLTVPCYAAGAITFLIIATISDKQQQRGIYVGIFSLISAIGYALLCTNISPGGHYAGCVLVAVGIYVSNLMPLAWLPTNYPRYGKRIVANGMQLTIGNLGGVASPFIYPSTDSPKYLMGQATCVAMLVYCAILYGGMSIYYTYRNNRRAAGLENHTIEGMSEEEIAELGDESPLFVFTK